jgi:hypothetical protein
MLVNCVKEIDLLSPARGFKILREYFTPGRHREIEIDNKLDYIHVKDRLRDSMKDVQTLPGEDNDSDCNLHLAKIFSIFKKIIRSIRGNKEWSWRNYMFKDRT